MSLFGGRPISGSVLQKDDDAKHELTGKDYFFWGLCSISTKTIFFLAIAFVIMLSAILAIILIAIPASFSNAEYVTMNQNARRFNRVLFDVGQDFTRQMTQYVGAWNESYTLWTNYNLNPNVSAMLSPSYSVETYFDTIWDGIQMSVFQVNLLAFYAVNGTFLVGRTYNIERNAVDVDPMPAELSFFPFSELSKFSSTNQRSLSFLTPLNSNKAYLVVAIPITTDFFEGPVNTIGLFAREITPVVMQDMAMRSQLCVTAFYTNNASDFETLNAIQLTTSKMKNLTVTFNSQAWIDSDIGSAMVLPAFYPSRLLQNRYCWNSAMNSTMTTDILESSVYSGFNIYNDIRQNVTTFFRLDVTRPLQTLSTGVIGTIIALLLVVSFVTFVIVFILLFILVIYRLFSLTQQIRNIWIREEFNLKVDVFGGKSDEIGLLSTVINNMLDTIHSSNVKISKFAEKLGKEQEKIKALLGAMPDPIMIVFPENDQIYYVNQTFEKILGYSMIDLDRMSPSQIFTDVDLNPLNLASLVKGGASVQVTCKNQEKLHVEIVSSEVEIEVDILRRVTLLVLRTQVSVGDTQRSTNKELNDINKILAFDESYKNKEIRDGYRKFLTKAKVSTVELDFLDDVEEYKALAKLNRSERSKLIQTKYCTEDQKFGLSKEDVDKLNKELDAALGELRLFQYYENKIKLKLVNESFTRFENEFQEKQRKKNKK